MLFTVRQYSLDTLQKLATFFSPVKIENFTRKTDIFNIFAQNIDRGIIDPFAEIVLTSTHNLCFGSKIRKLGKPLQTPFLNIKMGYKGVYFSRTCYPNDALKLEDEDED